MTAVESRVHARRYAGIALSCAMVGNVVLANWLTQRFGFIPIGFGLSATAGTVAAGAALALRDAVQDLAGRAAVLGLVAVGAGLSYLLASPALALASGVTFAVSECADMAVYTPIRVRASFGSRLWAVAVLVSGVIGAVVDTLLFLGLAFGWPAVMPALVGQLVGKTWALLAFVVIGKAVAGGFLLRQSNRQPEGA